MYQLIASDLDGTLLNANHDLDPRTVQTLQEIEASGVRFVIATGRHFLDVRGIRELLGVQAWLITTNGARVHDSNDQLVFAKDIEPSVARELMQADFGLDVHCNAYLDEVWLAGGHASWMGDMYQSSGFSYQIADLAQHDGLGVSKILYVGEHDDLLRVEEQLLTQYGDQLYITFSLPDCLEVMAVGVSKGDALMQILEHLNIPPSQCIAFGDGANDIQLLETVGHPFAMANAHPRLLAAVPSAERIGHHDDAAVAAKLHDLFKPGLV